MRKYQTAKAAEVLALALLSLALSASEGQAQDLSMANSLLVKILGPGIDEVRAGMDQALGSLCADLRRQRPSLQCAAQWNLDDLPGFRTLTEDEMTFGYPQSGWSVHVDLSEKVADFARASGRSAAVWGAS